MSARRSYNIDLGAHLAVCDSNYLRIVRLLPELRHDDLRTFHVVFRAAVNGSLPAATFEVIDRDRYTSVIALSQHAPDRTFAAERLETQIKVRLYHDARCAEVIEFQGQRWFKSVYAYPNDKMRHPDEKAQVNRFLTEFLNVCLTHGVVREEPVAAMDS